MRSFYEMSGLVGGGDKGLWLDLYWHLVDKHGSMRGQGPFRDPDYHGRLVGLLRSVGMGEEADELEMVRISGDDFEYGGEPLSASFGMDLGGVVASARDRGREGSFKAAWDAYNRHLESIMEAVFAHIQRMGWEVDLEGQYDLRYPGGEERLHRDARSKGHSLSGKFVPGGGGRPGWKYFVLRDGSGGVVASGTMGDVEEFLRGLR